MKHCIHKLEVPTILDRQTVQTVEANQSLGTIKCFLFVFVFVAEGWGWGAYRGKCLC